MPKTARKERKTMDSTYPPTSPDSIASRTRSKKQIGQSSVAPRNYSKMKLAIDRSTPLKSSPVTSVSLATPPASSSNNNPKNLLQSLPAELRLDIYNWVGEIPTTVKLQGRPQMGDISNLMELDPQILTKAHVRRRYLKNSYMGYYDPATTTFLIEFLDDPALNVKENEEIHKETWAKVSKRITTGIRFVKIKVVPTSEPPPGCGMLRKTWQGPRWLKIEFTEGFKRREKEHVRILNGSVKRFRKQGYMYWLKRHDVNMESLFEGDGSEPPVWRKCQGGEMLPWPILST